MMGIEGWVIGALVMASFLTLYAVITISKQLEFISRECAQTRELVARLVQIQEARGQLGR